MFDMNSCGPDTEHFFTKMRGLVFATALEMCLCLGLQVYVGQHIQEVTTALSNTEEQSFVSHLDGPSGEKHRLRYRLGRSG